MSDQEQLNSEQQNSEDENPYQSSEATKEVLIRMSDLPPAEECTIISIANSSMEEVADLTGISETQKYSKMAGILKRELDNRLGDGWYVICGKNFGTYVTHDEGTFIHFSFDELHVCCFKAH